MNPTDAINVAEKLAVGNAQTFLSFGLVALAGACVGLFIYLQKSKRDHIADVRACGTQLVDYLLKESDAKIKLAAAIEADTQVKRAMLEQLRAGKS